MLGRRFRYPKNKNIVYVVWIRKLFKRVPIYVGQSQKHVGRFGDYISGSFTSPTDFRVGTAIDYLRGDGWQVTFVYREVADRRRQEEKEKRRLRDHGYVLLDDALPGYDYKQADQEEEKCKIIAFVKENILRRQATNA